MHFYRWLAALRHKATSPLFPVYNVWGFLFSVSLHWLVLWFCIDALDRPCAKMKRWSFSIFCSNQMWFNFAAWVKRFFSSSHYFLSSFCHRFEEIVKKFKVEYHAGGATQNSVKIAQVCLSFFFFKQTKKRYIQRESFQPKHVSENDVLASLCWTVWAHHSSLNKTWR